MIIQIGTEADESRILWKHSESDEWQRADIDDLIDAYESRPTGWIPVSERLPDDDGRYLVTYPLLRKDDLWVATAWYGTPPMLNRPVKGKCFFVSDDEWGDVPYDDVVAWMPLPEPYKGGEEE